MTTIMMQPTRKATDEEIHILFHDGGVPAAVLAQLLETSRGHIYKCLMRHADPAGYALKEKKYVRPTKEF